MWTTVLLLFLSIVLGTGAWLLFVWAVKSDRYDDPEGLKHRILDDDDQAGPVLRESRPPYIPPCVRFLYSYLFLFHIE